MTTTKSWSSASPIAWPALLWIGGLHLGAMLALVPSYFSWTALGACLVLHWVTGGIGICMTYHRLLTHRSFAIRPRWLEYILTAIGCCASEGGPIGWVADHRNHHAHSDEEQDVHSPKRGLCLGSYVLVDDARYHFESHPRVLQEVGSRPVQAIASTGGSTVISSSFPFCCSWPFTALVRPALADLGRLRPVVLVLHRPGWSTRPPTSGATAATRPATPRRTSGGWPCSPSARAGTTTTMPSRPPPVTACGGGKST